MEAIILAGGLGTRLQSVVSSVPKPMAPIGGTPFLERLIRYWGNQGVERFVLSVGYLSEQIIRHFGDDFCGWEMAYAIEHTPLGTGGALIKASQELKHKFPFLVLNGDTFFDLSLIDLWRNHREKNADITVALTEAPAGSRYGKIEQNELGKITAFDTDGSLGSGFVNGGVYLMELGLWDDREVLTQPKSLEKELFPRLIGSGVEMIGVPFPGKFIDIGIPADYFAAEALFIDSGLKSTDK